MAFSNQFSLSIELTNLIPITWTIASTAYQTLMGVARDLKNSGSDLVVEEELAELFGRSDIDDKLASTFRTVLTRPPTITPWLSDTVLFSGAGPTVNRALRESYYFSTIVQCSFLTFKHVPASLAQAIQAYLAKLAEEAPQTATIRHPPKLTDIKSMLSVIEEQTEAFNWGGYLEAVASTLGLPDTAIHETIDATILHGLLPMLPLTQRFPLDKQILIEVSGGVCNLVVWAHVLLGLTVEVSIYDAEDNPTHFNFPLNQVQSPVQVVIEVRPPHLRRSITNEMVIRCSSITLFSTTPREELFRLKTDPDLSTSIDATCRGSAKGMAHRAFDNIIPKHLGRERLLQEVVMLTYRFSLRMVTLRDFAPYRQRGNLPAVRQHDKIFDAGKLFFDNPDWVLTDWVLKSLAQEDVDAYDDVLIKEEAVAPGCIKAILMRWLEEDLWTADDAARCWKALRHAAIVFAIYVVVFAHVIDIETCADLPVCENINVASSTLLYRYFVSERGADDWYSAERMFEVVSTLMLGRTDHALNQSASLISNRGWTVFVSTFLDQEPADLVIRRGIPWRHGSWWHKAYDGLHSLPRELVFSEVDAASVAVSLRCALQALSDKPRVGEGDDALLITLRFLNSSSIEVATSVRASMTSMGAPSGAGLTTVTQTGPRALWEAAWSAQRTQSCYHAIDPDEKVELEPSWRIWQGSRVKLTIQGGLALRRPMVCLTANISAARWQALLVILQAARDTPYKAMLRSSDCCLKCALEQTSSQLGALVLIL